MVALEVQPLPDLPSEAAAVFHRDFLPQAKTILASGAPTLTLLFSEADHTHRIWRLAAVQSLARENVPSRVNALAGGAAASIAVGLAYLEGANGVTGQYLPLDDAGAGLMV